MLSNVFSESEIPGVQTSIPGHGVTEIPLDGRQPTNHKYPTQILTMGISSSTRTPSSQASNTSRSTTSEMLGRPTTMRNSTMMGLGKLTPSLWEGSRMCLLEPISITPECMQRGADRARSRKVSTSCTEELHRLTDTPSMIA